MVTKVKENEQLIFNWYDLDIIEQEIDYYINDEPNMLIEMNIDVSDKVLELVDKYYDEEMYEDKHFQEILENNDLYEETEKAFKEYFFNSDTFWSTEFDIRIEYFNYMLAEIFGDNDVWIGEASDFGWRGVSGHGQINGGARDIIKGITPNRGDATIKVFVVDEEYLKCRVWHHDSSYYPDKYKLFPLSYFEKQIKEEINEMNDYRVLRELMMRDVYYIPRKRFEGEDRFKERREYLKDFILEQEVLE